jgi:hypothetical protein
MQDSTSTAVTLPAVGDSRCAISRAGAATRNCNRGGVLGKFADALVVKRTNGKSLLEGLNNFKVLVERH